jgi:hypothetical protein
LKAGSGAIHWLIDAHNVLHQDDQLKLLMDDPEAARAQLEELLDGEANICLFYDGGPGGRASTTRRHGMRIEYSGTQEADDCIIRWLKQNPGIRAMVVSDDRIVRSQARNLGAKTLSADKFLPRFRKAKRAGVNKPEPTEAEVEMWLKIFGDEERG